MPPERVLGLILVSVSVCWGQALYIGVPQEWHLWALQERSLSLFPSNILKGHSVHSVDRMTEAQRAGVETSLLRSEKVPPTSE